MEEHYKNLDKHFITKPFEGNAGYHYTLSSRLGDCLFDAEQLFGPRDKEFTILGVELCELSQPQVWYPGNRKHILIQLTAHTLIQFTDTWQQQAMLCYQLAHEVVHCLTPSEAKRANNLEEGLATHFARTYVREKFGIDQSPGLMEYAIAETQVQNLLEIDPDIIKRIRQRDPAKKISLLTSDDLLAENGSIPAGVANLLCRSFYN